MIVTQEQQVALVNSYMKTHNNYDQCIGFIDGVNATLDLLKKIENATKR